ncbi:MAG: protein-glutamate O-methyltransferase CheR [Alicyclobacillus sp.]|nr:protein-glutamate O-methyltransferase CheR [Alicyclobacillus sp.]
MRLEPPETNQERDFASFTETIQRAFGLDVAAYKSTQVRRRLAALCTRRGFRTFQDLGRAMQSGAVSRDEFMDHLTIHVTEFFRNPDRWRDFAARVVPQLATLGRPVRCWSAACSTGEEAYSLAITLAAGLALPQICIWATDVHPRVLEVAAVGRYPVASVAEMPVEDVRRFFETDGEQVVVRPSLRRCVQFAQHDLVTDRYPGGLDVVVCRNALIYFTDEAKERVLTQLCASLRTGGFLFVGGTEQIAQPIRYGLAQVSRLIYQKVDDEPRVSAASANG